MAGMEKGRVGETMTSAHLATFRARSRLRTIALSLSLGGILAVWPGAMPGADAWPDQRIVGPFVCRADFPLAEIDPLLGDLRRLQSDLASDLGLPPADEWIELYLFHDKPTYDRYLARYLPGVPYRRALYVKIGGQGRVFVYRGPQFEVDVRHECTHALLHAALRLVPLWLDEGLAEYYEIAREARANGNPHRNAVTWSARLAILPHLSELEKKRDLQDMGRGEYRFAWAWVHFMLHGSPETRQELVQYLGDLRAGRPPGLLSERLAPRLPNLNDRFAAYWKSPHANSRDK